MAVSANETCRMPIRLRAHLRWLFVSGCYSSRSGKSMRWRCSMIWLHGCPFWRCESNGHCASLSCRFKSPHRSTRVVSMVRCQRSSPLNSRHYPHGWKYRQADFGTGKAYWALNLRRVPPSSTSVFERPWTRPGQTGGKGEGDSIAVRFFDETWAALSIRDLSGNRCPW
jgi:hypothetical protein